jgi:HSP20 family molecular chaperone IbpA
MPAVDIVRPSGRLVARADVPGMKPEDIKVEVEDGVLEVTIPLPREAAQEKVTITPSAST